MKKRAYPIRRLNLELPKVLVDQVDELATADGIPITAEIGLALENWVDPGGTALFSDLVRATDD